jgi:glycerophosphoryl diester phosphodiesterase
MARSTLTFNDLLNAVPLVPFAHRGAGLLAPENTMAAFEHAVALGYPVIETDIQASRDGTLYVYHDKNLVRLTGTNAQIANLSDADIASIQVAGAHPLPKLADVLEAFPETLFNLDAKTWPATQPMAELIRKAGAEDRVCIGSFSEARIRKVVGQIGAGTCHSLGTGGAVRFYFAAQLGLPQRFSAACVQFPVTYKGVTLVNRRTVDYAHRQGLKVHVWTVNDTDEMERLLDLGVDGLMTDDCAAMRDVLEARGLWPDL